MKKVIFVFSIIMVVAMLAACGTPATHSSGNCRPPTAAPATAAPATAAPATAAPAAAAIYPKIVVAVQGDPSNLGPFVAMSMGRIGVLTTMYEYLFYQIGPELTPFIAKSYEKVDAKTYSVTLFENVTDSAGNHITAADVAYSYNTAMTLGNLRPLGDLAVGYRQERLRSGICDQRRSR